MINKLHKFISYLMDFPKTKDTPQQIWAHDHRRLMEDKRCFEIERALREGIERTVKKER